MRKLLICLAIIALTTIFANSVLARGEKSEIRFDIPSQSTGNNVRRASSESTKSFSSSGYGFEYIFSNKIGLGYRSESIQTEIESQGTVTKKQGLQSTALELSYRYSSSKGRSFLSRFNFQVGLGSVFSGKVLKHESSGNDLLSSYNSNHSVLGSTQFGAIGYNLGFMTIHVGYRIWDVWGYHSDSQKNTMDLGHMNWSSINLGAGFFL